MAKKVQAPRAVRAWLSRMGRKGGRARILALTPQQRQELGRLGAIGRWGLKVAEPQIEPTEHA